MNHPINIFDFSTKNLLPCLVSVYTHSFPFRIEFTFTFQPVQLTLVSVGVMGLVTSLASCLPLVVCSVSLPVVLWEISIGSILAQFGVSYVTVRPLLGEAFLVIYFLNFRQSFKSHVFSKALLLYRFIQDDKIMINTVFWMAK